MWNALLVLHILSGIAGLVLGPLAMTAPKCRGRHTTYGLAYQGAAFGLCASALGMVAFKPSLWWLGLIAIGTEMAAASGWLFERRRSAGWLPWHVSLMCGSYVSFITAFLVVNTNGDPAAWIAPTVVATPLIAATARRVGRGAART